jgi:hypothetical protein
LHNDPAHAPTAIGAAAAGDPDFTRRRYIHFGQCFSAIRRRHRQASAFATTSAQISLNGSHTAHGSSE